VKGKRKKRASPVADINVGPSIVQQQQVLGIDIMFIDKIPILIGVASPLGLTMATSLVSLDMQKPSRAASVVMRGITYFIGVLASRNFKTHISMRRELLANCRLSSTLWGLRWISVVREGMWHE
jgi:phosphatidylserine synthase